MYNKGIRKKNKSLYLVVRFKRHRRHHQKLVKSYYVLTKISGSFQNLLIPYNVSIWRWATNFPTTTNDQKPPALQFPHIPANGL